MKKLSFMKNRKFVKYVKKNLVLVRMIIIYSNYTIKSEITVITWENLEELLIIFVVFNNGSTYDYHFISKQLAKEFEGQFECLEENSEKYITFSAPIKKRTQ